jgi:hypothetical protein
MSKQTAVEWMIDKIINKQNGTFEGFPVLSFDEIFEQALKMEKEQMWEYIKKIYCIGHNSLEFHRLEFEQYYNETYKKNNV